MFYDNEDRLFGESVEKKTRKKVGRPPKNLKASLLDRVKTLEKEVALLKISRPIVDLAGSIESEPTKDPEWIPWKPANKGPNTNGKKVLVMLRSGEKFVKEEAKHVDQFTWREAGIRTIIAYSVV